MSLITVDVLSDVQSKKETQDFEIECDYLGNVFLKRDQDYYIISPDRDADNKLGIGLVKIKNIKYFRDNYKEALEIRRDVAFGEIKSSSHTLKGRAEETLDKMTEEEREEYSIKNNFNTYDTSFHESNNFWIKYDEERNEDEEDDNFFLNGVNFEDDDKVIGINISNLLLSYPASHNTVLINGGIYSKDTVSYLERKDGYCTSRLTIYTDGILRSNFISEKDHYSKLVFKDDELTIVPFSIK